MTSLQFVLHQKDKSPLHLISEIKDEWLQSARWKLLIAGALLATRKFHFKPFLFGCQSHMLFEIHHRSRENLVYMHWIPLKYMDSFWFWISHWIVFGRLFYSLIYPFPPKYNLLNSNYRTYWCLLNLHIYLSLFLLFYHLEHIPNYCQILVGFLPFILFFLTTIHIHLNIAISTSLTFLSIVSYLFNTLDSKYNWLYHNLIKTYFINKSVEVFLSLTTLSYPINNIFNKIYLLNNWSKTFKASYKDF